MQTTVVNLVNFDSISVNTEGVLDGDAEYAFTRGQCHALALVLHRLTGWQLYGLFTPYVRRSGGTPGHVVVQSPDGRFIDVTGDNALEDWHDHWPTAKAYPVTEAEVLNYENIDYVTPDLDAAAPFALTLWALYGKDQTTQPVQLRFPFVR